MIIEEKSIGDMPELGGMGILKATNMNEFKRALYFEKLYYKTTYSI